MKQSKPLDQMGMPMRPGMEAPPKGFWVSIVNDRWPTQRDIFFDDENEAKELVKPMVSTMLYFGAVWDSLAGRPPKIHVSYRESQKDDSILLIPLFIFEDMIIKLNAGDGHAWTPWIEEFEIKP